MTTASRAIAAICGIVQVVFLNLCQVEPAWSAGDGEDRLGVWLSKAFEVGKTVENPYNKAEALYRVADIYARTGQYDPAFKVIEAIEEPYKKTVSLVGTSGRAWTNGNCEQAERMRKLALETAESIEEPKWRATAYVSLAESYAKSSIMDEADHAYSKAIDIAEDIDDTQWKASLLAKMAADYLEWKNKEKSLQYLDRAFETAKKLEKAYAIGSFRKNDDRISVLDRIAEGYSKAGENEKAREVRETITEMSTIMAEKSRIVNIMLAARKYEEALKTAETIENLHTRAHSLNGIAVRVWEDGGAESFALEVVAQALETAGKIKDEHVRSKALGPIAMTCAQHGYFDKAVSAMKDLKDKAVLEMTLSRLAGVFADAGKYPEARKTAESIEDMYYRSRALDSISAAKIKNGERGLAAEVEDQALAAAQKIEDSYRRNELYSCLSGRFSEMGKYDRGLEVAEFIEDPYHKSTALYWTVYWAGMERKFDRAAAVAEEIEDPYYRASAFSWLAEKLL